MWLGHGFVSCASIYGYVLKKSDLKVLYFVMSNHTAVTESEISIFFLPFLSTEPHFVSAYEVGRFTYLFLRENAVEQDCGKTVFSRVARVCQNDIGGRFLLEDTWTTFMKARLNCSRSGDVPFYYHELQSTFYLPEQDLIYGVFTTNVWVDSSSITEIAVHRRSTVTQQEFL